MTPVTGVLCALGMVVVVPLGLRLLDDGSDPTARAWARLWPVAGAVGALSLVIPRGGLAAGLALVYAGATVALALSAVGRLARRRSLVPAEVAVLAALVMPAVAGVALLAERSGVEPVGLEGEVLALAVAHLHVTGFAAALVAGLACHATGSRWADVAALAVPAGTALVLAGYLTADVVGLVGAALFTGGAWVVAVVVWSRVRPVSADGLTRALFAVSCLVLAAATGLALVRSVGVVQAAVPGLPAPWTVAAHGLAGALGFAVCGLVAWHRLAAERTAAALPCEAQRG